MKANRLVEEIQNIKVRYGIEEALIAKKFKELSDYGITTIREAKDALEEMQKDLTGLNAEIDLLVRKASETLSFYEEE